MPDLKEEGSVFFRSWANLILKYRISCFLLCIAVSAILASQIPGNLIIDNSSEAFLPSKSEARDTLDEFRDEFGNENFYLIIAEGNVFSKSYLEQTKKLQNELKKINIDLDQFKMKNKAMEAEEKKTQADIDFKLELDDFGETEEGWGEESGGSIFEEVSSILNFRKTKGSEDGIEVSKLFDPIPSDQEILARKQEVLSDPNLAGNLLSQNGRYSVIVLRTVLWTGLDSHKTGKAILKAIKEVVAKHQKENFKLKIGGMPTFGNTINSIIIQDVRTMVVLALSISLAILIFIFRNFLAVAGPVLVVIQAAVCTLGLMAALGIPVTMVSNIIPSFLFCVGLGDSIHFLSLYRDGKKVGMETNEAITHSLSHCGMPIVFTSITTMTGLLSFKAASVDSLAEMGFSAAFGVFMAMVFSLTFLPVVISLSQNSLMGAKDKGEADFIDKMLNFCNNLSHNAFPKRKILVTGVMIILSIIATINMLQLKVHHDPLLWISEKHETRKAFAIMDKEIGGSASAHLLIEPLKPGGLKTVEFLKAMENFEKDIEKYIDSYTGKPLITNFSSILDIAKETNQALNGGKPEAYKIPNTDRGVADSLFLFENAGQEHLRRMATGDLGKTHITMRMRWRGATYYVPFVKYLNETAEKNFKGIARARATGTVYNLTNTESNLISDLIKSFSLAIAVITVVMIIVLRNTKLGLIAMIPNLVPILFILGFMNLANIPIDMANLLIASIAIGIAVDDTIHFLYHYKVHYEANGDPDAAIDFVMKHSGRALVSTSVILFFGFLVYLGATISSIQLFGVLVGLTIFFALFIDLIATPAILRLIYKKAKPQF